MKIGVIGTKKSIELVNEIIDNSYPEVQYFNLLINQVKNVKNIVEDLPKDIDGIFVTGIGVYFELLNYDFNIPISYAKHGAMSLIKTLQNMENDKVLDRNINVSFDIVSDTTVDDIINEFNYNINNYYIKEINSEYDEDFYITYHLKLLHEEKIDYVVTSFGYIYELFKSIGLPVYRMLPSIMDLKMNIEDLITEINMAKLDRSKILVYRFISRNNTDLMNHKKVFIKFARSLDAFIDFNEDNSITIISTKNHYNITYSMSILNDFLRLNNLTNISSGIGTDISVHKALKNSQKALMHSKCSEITFFNGFIYESFDENDILTHSFSLSEKDLQKISEDTEIIYKRIYQLYSSIVTLNKNIFSSDEIAEILDLSVRSANRIISALIKNGYAKFIGTQTTNKSGRPKRLVEINLLDKTI